MTVPASDEVLRFGPDQVQRLPAAQDPYAYRPPPVAPPVLLVPRPLMALWQAVRQRFTQAFGEPPVAPGPAPAPSAPQSASPRTGDPVPPPALPTVTPEAAGGGTFRYMVAAAGVGAALVGIAAVAATAIHRAGYARGLEEAAQPRRKRQRNPKRRRQSRAAREPRSKA